MSAPDTNLFSLDGRRVAVIGGAGQIGRATCEVLAAAGARIAVVDLPGEHLDGLVARLRGRFGARVISLPQEITNPAVVEEGAQELRTCFGGLDVLVNHAHFKGNARELRPHAPFFAPLEDYPFDVWRRTLQVNLDGLFLTTKAYGRLMIESGGGSLITTSSTYGLVSPNPKIYGDSGINSPIPYATTKAAILGFTRYVGIHWARHGIRANTLCPGGVSNPRQSAEFVRAYCDHTPLGKMAAPEDYQGAVLFLASDASRYMTGAALTVDGGWTAW